ncbi:hypothetical protein JL720_4416 [Aureococcus anophagefferens]|nr:hypothetical protein JL720_4416 [Aureococcus anophagefferens]
MGWSVAAFAWICLIARASAQGTAATADGSSIATRTRNSGYRALVQRIVDDGIAKHPKFRELKPYQHIVSLMSKAQGAHRRRRARYADLRALFGAGSDFDANVAEVGVGYGAQSDVVQRLGGLLDGAPARDRRYTLCDLPEVEKLAGQYLAAVRRSEEPPRATLNAAPDATATCGATNFTLFLSNYAFELSDVQQIYWDQIVKCSARGYVTMNGYNGMTTRDPGPTKGEATRRQFRIWCDYDKNINAMQWRAADAARAAVRH